MADSGRLVRANWELTSLYDDLNRVVRDISDSAVLKRSITLLGESITEIPAFALAGTIITVPSKIPKDTQYRLPQPKDVFSIGKKKSYDVFIRNDSSFDISIETTSPFIVISGPNTISSQSGSQWHLSFICLEEGRLSYSFTRLI